MQISAINPHYNIRFSSFKKANQKKSSEHFDNDELMKFLNGAALINASQVEKTNISTLLGSKNVNVLLRSGTLDLSDIREISQLDEQSFKHSLELIENDNFVSFLNEKHQLTKAYHKTKSSSSGGYSLEAIKTISSLDDKNFEQYLGFFNNRTIFRNIKDGNFDILCPAIGVKNNAVIYDDLITNLEEMFSSNTLSDAGKDIIHYYEEDYFLFANQKRCDFQREFRKIEELLRSDVIKDTCEQLGKIDFRQLVELSKRDDENIRQVLKNVWKLAQKTLEVYEEYECDDCLMRADGILELSLSKPQAIEKYKRLLENKGFLKSNYALDMNANYIESLINLSDGDFNKFDSLMRNKSVQKAVDDGLFDRDSFSSLLKLSDESIKNIDSLIKEINEQKKTVLKHPELYINGEISDYQQARDEIDYFFTLNASNMAVFLEYSDKETLNHLLRQRFDNAQNDLISFLSFSKELKELYGKLQHCRGIENKPLTPAQKLQLVTLIQAYEDLCADYTQINQMADDGVVDLDKLNSNLTEKIMIKMGVSQDEFNSLSQEKLSLWNIANLHYLSQYTAKDAFRDVVKASCHNFEDYIQGNNKYGKTNLNTKKEFEENNLNYADWINPESDLEVMFKTKNENDEQIDVIIKQIEKNMQTLLNTNVKGAVNKRFPHCIKNGRFKIPDEINNKDKLTRFIKNIIEQLNDAWERALVNQYNPLKAKSADLTLNVLMRLKGSLYDIESIESENKVKAYDLKIKMWDRTPQKDLFQGNYSTCCIAMGATNADNMPHYLLNTAFNMIEIVDNTDNKVIGNALCYFVKDDKNNPVLVIDNIEINNASKPNEDKTGIGLRNAIVEYASNVAKRVAGKNIPVYIGDTHALNTYNDVPVYDLTSKLEKVRFIGDIDCNQIYMDLYSGITEKIKLKEESAVFARIA